MTHKTDSAPTNETDADETSAIPLMNDKMVDMTFITELTGLSDKWFYKLIKDGAFPKPIKLGRSSRWLQSEVESWLQERIEASRGKRNRGDFLLSYES
ncbi:Predicted transcriptional regulator [Serratia fonticola]|nr:Predicted transcriptional regulator [Serratia fonticola]